MAELRVPVWNADAHRLMFDPAAMTQRRGQDASNPSLGAKDASRITSMKQPPQVSPTFLMMAAGDLYANRRLFAEAKP